MTNVKQSRPASREQIESIWRDSKVAVENWKRSQGNRDYGDYDRGVVAYQVQQLEQKLEGVRLPHSATGNQLVRAARSVVDAFEWGAMSSEEEVAAKIGRPLADLSDAVSAYKTVHPNVLPYID
jgi:hypothetical protein